MDENKGKVFDYGIIFLVSNLILLLAMYTFCIVFVLNFVHNNIMQAVLIIVLLPICAWIEHRWLTRIIGPFVEKLLPKSYKRTKLEYSKRAKEANKKGYW